MKKHHVICSFLHYWHHMIGGSLRVTLVVDWWFLPKILGPWWGPTKAIYCSVNADRVIILFAGGGDTWTEFCTIKLVWTFCTERWWGAKNLNLWSGWLTCMVNSLSACWDAANIYGVVILFGCGGDTPPLFFIIKIICTCCPQWRWGPKNKNYWSGRLTCMVNSLLACWDAANIYGAYLGSLSGAGGAYH